MFSQDDLARRKAARDIRRSPLDVPIDSRIAGGGGREHQTACVEGGLPRRVDAAPCEAISD